MPTASLRSRVSPERLYTATITLMKKIILFAARHPWALLLIVTAITIAAASQLDQLKFNISAQSMMVEGGADIEFYRKTLDTFGSEDVTILFVSDADLFEADKLASIKEAIDGIESLPFVSRTESLYSINDIKTVDENIELSPYLAKIPDTPEAAKAIITSALENPFIADNLLSPSGNSMAINIYFNARTDDPDFDQLASRELDRFIAPLDEKLDTAYQIGSSYIRSAISEKITQDQKTVLPLALLVLLVTLGLTLRRLSGVVIPLLTAGLSVVWTLGLMAAIGLPVNVMTSIVPALLVIIGSTEDIHLLSEYLTGISKGLDKRAAIDRMANKMSLAITLTFITTYLGFLSISLNDLQLLREFGLVASTGLLLNFLITVLLVPVSLRLFGSTRNRKKRTKDSSIQRLAGSLFRFIQQHRRATIVVSVLILLLASAGASLLRVNNNSLDYFGTDSPVIQRIQTLQNEIAGIQTFSIVLTAGIEDTFLKLRYLEEVEKLQHFLTDSGIADKTLSFVDYLAMINKAMMDEEDGNLELPEEDELVQEYMLFVDHKHVKSFVSDDFSQVNILVRHQIESSYELGQAVDRIRAFADSELDAGLRLNTTGQSVLTARAADYLASAQAKSLMLMVVVIMIIVSLLFVNTKAGIFAVIPNLFPIIVLFGFMGFSGIPLDTGTAMTAAIAIGICVDDTMHFMVRYHQISQTEKNEQRVLEQTVLEESIPIVSTSIALACGFGALAMSDFPPIAYFGLLSALVMLLALVATFIITPTLLSFTRLITVWDLLSVHLQTEITRSCKLFAGMRPSQIKRAILLSSVHTFAQGDVVIKEGEPGRDFFVILEGSADAQITPPNEKTIHIRRMEAGDVFGEIALVSNVPRTADVVAHQDLKVLVMDWDSISRITKVYPRIAAKLYQNLSSILGERLACNTPSSQIDDA